jgi:hypothetical protein
MLNESMFYAETPTPRQKKKRCFRHRLTCDFVAINLAAGIFTLRSKLTCSLLHSFRFRHRFRCSGARFAAPCQAKNKNRLLSKKVLFV